MEIQQLRHFLGVARHGSIGQAADALNLSQPGLSRSIRALEDTLGLALFERQARGVALTDHGRQLLVRAEVIVNEHDRALAEARSAGNLRSGDVRLGLHDVIAAIGTAGAIDQFLRDNPAITLGMQVAAGAELVDRVARAELDLAFTLFLPGQPGGGLCYEPLLAMRSLICQRRDARESIAATASLAELADRRWILAGGMNLRQAFEQAHDEAGLPIPAQILQSSSLALTLDLVLRQDLLTILPEPLLAMPQLAGRMETSRAPAPGGAPTGGLIYRHDLMRLPAASAVAACFRNFAATL